MLYSKKGNFIFIANPKTATSSFQDSVMDYDDTAMKNAYKNKGILINKIPAHATAFTIKKLLQNFYLEHYKICFVRNPYDKAVSAYFFLQNARPMYHGSVFNYNNNPKVFFKAVINKLKMIYAKLLPFEIWSLLNTKKRNISYLVDNNGIIIVNYICKTENLEKELPLLLKKIGYQTIKEFKLAKYNQSKHKETEKYFKKRWHKYLFDLKYKDEIKFYKALDKNDQEDLYGISLKDILSTYVI